jgi:hypothetical protein
MISSSVQAGMDSFDGLSFASEEGSYNSATKFVESLKTLLLTSGDVLPLIKKKKKKKNLISVPCCTLR